MLRLRANGWHGGTGACQQRSGGSGNMILMGSALALVHGIVPPLTTVALIPPSRPLARSRFEAEAGEVMSMCISIETYRRATDGSLITMVDWETAKTVEGPRKSIALLLLADIH
jgi:hypothetical protein